MVSSSVPGDLKDTSRQTMIAFFISIGQIRSIPSLVQSSHPTLTAPEMQLVCDMVTKVNDSFHRSFPRQSSHTIPPNFHWGRCLRDCLRDRHGRSQCRTVLKCLELFHTIYDDPRRIVQHPLEDEDVMNVLITMRRQPRRARRAAAKVARFVQEHHQFRSSNIDAATRMFRKVRLFARSSCTKHDTGPRRARDEKEGPWHMQRKLFVPSMVVVDSSSDSTSSESEKEKDLTVVASMKDAAIGKCIIANDSKRAVQALTRNLSIVTLNETSNVMDGKSATAAATEAAKVVDAKVSACNAPASVVVVVKRSHHTRLEQLASDVVRKATWTVRIWDLQTGTCTQPLTPFALRLGIPKAENDDVDTFDDAIPDVPSPALQTTEAATLSIEDIDQIQANFRYQNTHVDVVRLLQFVHEREAAKAPAAIVAFVLSVQIEGEANTDAWVFFDPLEAVLHASIHGAFSMETEKQWMVDQMASLCKLRINTIAYSKTVEVQSHAWTVLGYHDSARDVTSHWERLASVVKVDNILSKLDPDCTEFAGRIVSSRWDMESKTGMPLHKYVLTECKTGDTQSYSDVALLWRYPDCMTPYKSITAPVFSNDSDKTLEHRASMLVFIRTSSS